MGLRPFFGYYGGKWRDTPRFYSSPEHDIIVEPFAGSAGYSLRHAEHDVRLYEIDPILVGVWDFLIHADVKDILSIPDVPIDGSVDDLPDSVSQEARWLVGFWLNRGTSSPRKQPSKWMRDGVRPGSFWGDRVRGTIASQLKHIRHWQIKEASYDEIEFDTLATWFVDPPYQEAGRHYRFGSDQIDYDALAEWCRTRPGQVIVCENLGAKWLPFTRAGSSKTTRAGKRSKEVFWEQHRNLAAQTA